MLSRTLVDPTTLEVGEVIQGPVRITSVKADARKVVVTVELVRDTMVLPADVPVWRSSE